MDPEDLEALEYRSQPQYLMVLNLKGAHPPDELDAPMPPGGAFGQTSQPFGGAFGVMFSKPGGAFAGGAFGGGPGGAGLEALHEPSGGGGGGPDGLRCCGYIEELEGLGS